MIQKESILAAIGLAEHFAEKNLVVVAKPSTLMSELVTRTNADILAPIENDPGYAIFADNIEQLTTGALEKPSLHDQYSDEAIEAISTAVRGHISFAKNIVKPIVVDVAEGTLAYLREFRYPQAADQFCVNVVDVPELLEDESFTDRLSDYQGKLPLKPEAMPSLGKKTGEELLALMLTGDKDADVAITTWYTRLGNDWFVNLWENLFRDNQPDRGVLKAVYYDDILGYDLFERADYALALYLLADKLFDNVDESAAGLNLVAYQNIIAQTRDFGGAMLANTVERAKSFEATKIMVIQNHQPSQSAKVFGKVYRPWLATGGCAEMILGMIVSGRNLTTTYSVDEVKQQLLETWKTHSAFFIAAESNKRFDYFKEAIKLKFNEVMANLTDTEQEFISTAPNYQQVVMVKLENELAQLRPQDADDMYAAALKLVCRARFYYTQAEAILGDMVEASKVNPNVDVREAALISTTNYVIDFVASQLAVVQV
jgi:hypothetical protein